MIGFPAIKTKPSKNKIDMEDFKPKRNLLQLARATRLYAMAKVDAHDRTMGDFKTAHPDDYVKHPTFWALKKESYELRDAYYEAKEKVLDRKGTLRFFLICIF